jgi:hypothetical protein
MWRDDVLLLARICDIRSSEKVFWRKVLEIYAASIDYVPAEEISQMTKLAHNCGYSGTRL